MARASPASSQPRRTHQPSTRWLTRVRMAAISAWLSAGNSPMRWRGQLEPRPERQGVERPASLTLGGDRCEFLNFRYLACRPNALPWEDWRDSDNLLTGEGIDDVLH